MKKLIVVLITALAFSLSVAARDRVTRNLSELPAAAQSTLQKYFGKNKVNHIKIDKKTFGGADYDVVLDNGTEIDFDSAGNWTEIECGANKLPDGLVIKPIADYIKRNFKGQKIVAIEVSRAKYEIELTGGIELEFDRSGAFRKASH